eukprot:gb/GFBE01004712.1/.p1 GENE.gb/GFBE01004712.1/~~gb/GFBE01004712.1/.p1  ORF type:complete len:213 (+),score=64.84 gb/GFBE01004712.1/:1-639(+)
MSVKQLKATVAEVFKKWDITGDGCISKYELHAALTKLGMKEKDVAKVFDAVDISRDGFLQYEEFMGWVFKDPKVISAYSLKSAKERLVIVDTNMCREMEEMLKPPDGVDQVFFAVLVIFGEDRELSWDRVRSVLRNPRTFLDRINNFDLGTVTPELLEKLEPYISQPGFNADALNGKSLMASRICAWVLAIASMGIKDVKEEEPPKDENADS